MKEKTILISWPPPGEATKNLFTFSSGRFGVTNKQGSYEIFWLIFRRFTEFLDK